MSQLSKLPKNFPSAYCAVNRMNSIPFMNSENPLGALNPVQRLVLSGPGFSELVRLTTEPVAWARLQVFSLATQQESGAGLRLLVRGLRRRGDAASVDLLYPEINPEIPAGWRDASRMGAGPEPLANLLASPLLEASRQMEVEVAAWGLEAGELFAVVSLVVGVEEVAQASRRDEA